MNLDLRGPPVGACKRRNVLHITAGDETRGGFPLISLSVRAAARLRGYHARPPKPAKARSFALQGAALRIRFRGDALGNALGGSLVDAMAPASDSKYALTGSGTKFGEGRSSVRLGTGDAGDSIVLEPDAGLAYNDGTPPRVGMRYTNAGWQDLDGTRPVVGDVLADAGAWSSDTDGDPSGSSESLFPSAKVVARGVDASGRPWTDYDSGSTTNGVLTPVIETRNLLPAAATGAADPFSLVTPDYHVAPGPVSRYYQGQVALFSDSNQPWYVRSLSFVNATLAAPVMLFEEGGRGIMNVPYAGSQLGQHAAIFNQATDVDTKVIAGLSMVKFGSEGFVNAFAAGVLGRQVYVRAQDEAVSFWLKREFDGDIRKFNEVYTSAVDGTRRLGYSFSGVNGYRAANTAEEALSGRYLSLERPASPAYAIERSALSPLWGNNATELYQVSSRSGFYFKGQVAPQSGWYQGSYFNLGGGNAQVFMPSVKVDGEWISPIVSGKKVPYGN